MPGELYVAIIILIYVLTFVVWYLYGKEKRLRNVILLINLGLAILYTALAAIGGDDECGVETWFCFKWYDYAIIFGLLHLAAFWVLMVLQMIIELIINYFTPDKNIQQ